MAAASPSQDLAVELARHTGRFADKTPDWDAFPANRGYPELARAQIRYIGAGGSPKHDDPGTLPAEHFTLSLIYQEPGKYAATHHHEIEEAFFVVQGVLTVTWDYEGQQLEAKLGPKDLILNPPDRPHGFRNDGIEPVIMSVMVGSARPLAPVYDAHPKDAAAINTAGAKGASPNDRADFDSHIVRYRDRVPRWDAAGFARLPYLGEGGIQPGHYRDDIIHLPPGKGAASYERPVEEAYFVLQGVLTVLWEADGQLVTTRLGSRDLVLNPPGRRHSFRNDGVEDVQFEMVIGTPVPETVRFQAA